MYNINTYTNRAPDYIALLHSAWVRATVTITITITIILTITMLYTTQLPHYIK